MGIFNRKPGFLKPGKGVERNAKKKNAFFRFFEVLYRKFNKIVILNIIYTICILPIICGVIVLLTAAFQLSDDLVRGSFLISNVLQIVSNIPVPVSLGLLIIDLILFGPLTAGFSYMLRNYADERHAWFSDFFSRTFTNFKQGIVLGLIDALVFVSVILYLAADISALKGSGMYYVYFALKTAACLIALFYVFMRFYTYNITVTFELSVRDILKNSAIFAVLGFVRNIIAFVAIVATVFAFTSTWVIDAVLLVMFLFSFCGFIVSYTTYPVIKKYMLKAQSDNGEDESSEDLIEEEYSEND